MERDGGAGPSLNELIQRARAGDQGARAALFTRCRPELERLAAQRLGRLPAGVARPSDIVQETALHAYKGFETFKGNSEGEWIAWLRSIFRSRTLQLVRDAKRKKREGAGLVSMDSPEAAEAPSPEKSPSQASARHEEWRLLFGYIHQLPDDQREAIWLCHLKELPVAEVARIMGRSPQSVAGLLQRGLHRLRQRMAVEALEAAPASLGDAAEALLAYLQRRDCGEQVDTAAFVAEHPACADQLSAMLHWIERIQAIKPAAATAS
ncbi:MAG: sigma-70 family RNA polymerase sigma factor [Minicystis sp.]